MKGLLFISICFLPAIIAMKEGPCTMGAHQASQDFKCTANGYFELVQCPTAQNYCACVDPSNGHEATLTKTNSNKQAPTCGVCHVLMAQIFASSSAGVRIPQCEGKTGNFQPKQCLDDLKCWCVDKETGKKLESDKETSNSDLNCDAPPVNFSLDPPKLISLDKEDASAQMIPVGSPNCKLPKNKGKACTGSSPRVQWFFDMDTFECLAFKHSGCEGNENKFDSVSECWSACKLADMGGCAGMRPSAKNSKGEGIICDARNENSKECPQGYRCSMMAFFGICCHIETQELFKRNYRPVCDNGRNPQKITSGGVPMTLIGKECSDNFCPPNTECHKKEVFAHCCPK